LGGAQDMGYIEGDLWLQVISGSLKDPQSGYLYTVVNKTWVQQMNNPILGYFDGFYETFIPQTIINYSGNKQVLSTPFLFYFGLKPEKTALDLLIKYFGPKGAFPTESIPCPIYDITPTPSATPAASLLPNPSAPATSNPWVTPSPTPMPTPTASPLPPTLTVSPNSMSWEWDHVGTGYQTFAYLDINNMEYWYLGTTPSPSSFAISYLDLNDNEPGMITGRAPISGLPDWINMEYTTDFGTTWFTVQNNTPYSYQLTMLRFYPNEGNYTGANRLINVYFSNGITNFMGGDQYITVSQTKQPVILGITYEWIYEPEILTPVSNSVTAGDIYTYYFSWQNDNFVYGSNVPWTIYRIVNTTTEVLKSGTINNVRPGHIYSMSDSSDGVLDLAPNDGDKIYIQVGNIS
jgi:hypothetical protein